MVLFPFWCRDVARRVSTDSRHDMTAVQIHSVPAEWICKNNQNPNTECRNVAEKKRNFSIFTTVCIPIHYNNVKNFLPKFNKQMQLLHGSE